MSALPSLARTGALPAPSRAATKDPMAKKSKATHASGSSAKAPKEVPPLVKAIDVQFERGNFMAVRQLAAQGADLDEDSLRHVSELVEKTKTDPHAWMIAAGAILLILLVGLMTLN